MMNIDKQAREATAWAAGTITRFGGTLYPVTGGWDVELADGSWRAAEGWRGLCEVAHEVAAQRWAQGAAV
jgi:hypothetical protein